MDRLENILGEVDMERGYQLLTPRERNIISLYYLEGYKDCLLYTSPSPRDRQRSRIPSSA